MVIMVVASAIVRKVGKDLNVIYPLVNVKCQIAQIMDVALKVNAIVNVVGKDHFVINVSIQYFSNIFQFVNVVVVVMI